MTHVVMISCLSMCMLFVINKRNLGLKKLRKSLNFTPLFLSCRDYIFFFVCVCISLVCKCASYGKLKFVS